MFSRMRLTLLKVRYSKNSPAPSELNGQVKAVRTMAGSIGKKMTNNSLVVLPTLVSLK